MKRIRLKQVIPDGPPAAFTIVEHKPGDSRYHARLRDAICGDEPEFELKLPAKSKYPPPTPQRVANAAAGELNEATGAVFLTRYTDGIPTFAGVFVSNGRQVICVASTDPAQCEPIDVAARCRAWLTSRTVSEPLKQSA
jgi:hypothetical protein